MGKYHGTASDHRLQELTCLAVTLYRRLKSWLAQSQGSGGTFAKSYSKYNVEVGACSHGVPEAKRYRSQDNKLMAV